MMQLGCDFTTTACIVTLILATFQSACTCAFFLQFIVATFIQQTSRLCARPAAADPSMNHKPCQQGRTRTSEYKDVRREAERGALGHQWFQLLEYWSGIRSANPSVMVCQICVQIFFFFWRIWGGENVVNCGYVFKGFAAQVFSCLFEVRGQLCEN